MPTPSTLDIQARLDAMGYSPGPLDGQEGPKTRAALVAAGGHKELDWHPSGLRRIILHWTAGTGRVSDLERRHYHRIIDADGEVHPGDHPPEANADIGNGPYAPHTRALNTGSIGVAVSAMAGARERPFDAGDHPITVGMLDALVAEVADLSETYNIPVGRGTVLTHAEVQPTLGVRQRGKWDIAWIPGMHSPGNPVEVGDTLRARVKAVLSPASAGRTPVAINVPYSFPPEVRALADAVSAVTLADARAALATLDDYLEEMSQ